MFVNYIVIAVALFEDTVPKYFLFDISNQVYAVVPSNNAPPRVIVIDDKSPEYVREAVACTSVVVVVIFDIVGDADWAKTVIYVLELAVVDPTYDESYAVITIV